MAKTAAEVAGKMVARAGQASGDYVEGAKKTSKDQASAAIAAIPNMKLGINEAIDKGRVARGLNRSGKSGWLSGIETKGQNRFGEGVAAGAPRYAERSGAFDSARGAASSILRGPKGSPQNLQRVAAVVAALRTKKLNG